MSPHGGESSNGITREICESTKVLGGREYTIHTSAHPGLSPKKKLIMLAMAPAYGLVLSGVTAVMLLVREKTRSSIAAKMITKFCSKLSETFCEERKTLLSSVQGKVMDLGSGAGAYMQHLCKADKVVALEPMQVLHPRIEEEADKAGIKELDIVSNNVEDYFSSDVHAAGSFDWVILGNVLCEVTSQGSTLETVDKLLKVGGYIYFFEHVGYKRGTILRCLQNVINPWWVFLSHGCNCNRDSLDMIRAKENWEVISWQYNNLSPFPLSGPFVLGLARKTS